MNEITKMEHAGQALVSPSGDTPPSLMNFVAMALKDPSIDVAKLEALLRMQREIVADDARTQFNQAMARLQMRLPRIKKNGRVEYPKNKNQPDGPKELAFTYARWEDVDKLIRPILNEEGFSLSFNTKQRSGDGGGLIVTGRLLHISGHAETADMALPLDTSGGKSNLQGYASSTSFGSRYVAKMLLNLIFEGEDDDGVTGGTVYIDDAQIVQIQGLLAAARADIEAFCNHFGIESLPKMRAKDVGQAVNMLNSKIAKAAKGAQS